MDGLLSWFFILIVNHIPILVEWIVRSYNECGGWRSRIQRWVDGLCCCSAGSSSCQAMLENDGVETEDDETLDSDLSYETRVRCGDVFNDCLSTTSSKSLMASSSDSSSVMMYGNKRRVRFSIVRVRNYKVVSWNKDGSYDDEEEDDSDNDDDNNNEVNALSNSKDDYTVTSTTSSTTTNGSVTLDWTYTKERQIPVELFERARTISSNSNCGASTFRIPRKSKTRRKIVGTPISATSLFSSSSSSRYSSERPVNIEKFEQLLLS